MYESPMELKEQLKLQGVILQLTQTTKGVFAFMPKINAYMYLSLRT